MILCDVGVFVSAYFEHSPHHRPCRAALDELLGCGEPFGLSDLVLSAVVRIGSNPRIFSPAPAPSEIFAYVDAIRASPNAVRIEPGPRHWSVLRDIVDASGIRGADVTDAWFAALALEHGCDWWTTDRDFARFSGLRYRNLLD